jgi:formate hydrogenlyase transcriptional activator
VLQDHEFERLGSNKTIHVNVRVIAATNRDLARAVAEHEFRSDLYYRLNVFPIYVPPLRDRVEDISLLVNYFVEKFARLMGKTIELIPTEIIAELERWYWPGNIRELQNFIERSVILTRGPILIASQPGCCTLGSRRSLRATLEASAECTRVQRPRE